MTCKCGYNMIELSRVEMLDEWTTVNYCNYCGRAAVIVEDELTGKINTVFHTPIAKT